MRSLSLWLSMIFFCIYSAFGYAQPKTVYLTSLEWPPYTGKTLTEQGASSAVVKAAFEAVGYKVVIEFFPWSRAVKLASDPNSKYLGYMPEYYSADLKKQFAFSAPIGSGPLGFVEQTGNPIAWTRLSDLKAQSIGVVQDYVNTAEFDGLVAYDVLKAQPVPSDVQNLKKVAAG